MMTLRQGGSFRRYKLIVANGKTGKRKRKKAIWREVREVHKTMMRYLGAHDWASNWTYNPHTVQGWRK